jgi:hypothetical protein
MFNEDPELAQKGTRTFKGMVILVSTSKARMEVPRFLSLGFYTGDRREHH